MSSYFILYIYIVLVLKTHLDILFSVFSHDSLSPYLFFLNIYFFYCLLSVWQCIPFSFFNCEDINYPGIYWWLVISIEIKKKDLLCKFFYFYFSFFFNFYLFCWTPCSWVMNLIIKSSLVISHATVCVCLSPAVYTIFFFFFSLLLL